MKLPLGRPVAVLALHGQLAPVAWAFAQAMPDARLGYVQSEGGALPGGHSRTVRELRERGLLAGHLTAGAAFGGEGEAITTAGALHHGLAALGWDAAVCGPGPGIVGSDSPLGPRRAVGARHRARGARARVRDAARRADVLGRSTRAPPRYLPPHAHRARPAARARHGRAAGGDALARRRRPARRSRRGLRRSDAEPAADWRSTSSVPRASPATTGAARRSTCRRT